MSAEIDSLVLEHLRAIRATQAEHSERLDRMDLRLSVIEQTIGSRSGLSPLSSARISCSKRREG
ncbi:hypothetical protein [Allochromatium tepidum]|uniref:Uncharacterized protein n=1 Tax=Allochromatium tepidum TaxID=553982 RepID=A0ABM7QKS7_9GAMM|nr:hypothetical protein [Allochromatium tepidum]BCU06350.1 hypothetical protein Atep_10270 [Allochromatium tepidum]